jgi:hypothetical protein
VDLVKQNIRVQSPTAVVSTPRKQDVLWGADLINYIGNNLQPKLFFLHNARGSGVPHNVLPLIFPNEPVEKVNFLKSVPSAGSKIRNDHFLWL